MTPPGRGEPLAPRQATLDEATRRFLHDGDLPALLDAVMAEALAVTGVDRGCLHIVGAAGGGLRLAVQRGITWPLIEYVASLRTGIAGPVGPGAQRALVDDVATSPLVTGPADRDA